MYGDHLQKYYAKKYDKALRGMKISFTKKMRKAIPEKRFKTEIRIEFIIHEVKSEELITE
jgi:uncharacterized OsmC-like protein